ncbi:MAG: LysR family transcriptional regulator, partial [Lysobacteraceae bacterium]
DIAAVAANLHHGDSIVRLRISTLHSLTYCWLLPRLPDFCAAFPNIRVNIEANIALTRFDEEGPDLGIRHGPGQWPGLTAHHLMDDELFPVASPALAGVDSIIDARQIADLPLVSDMALQGWRDWFRAAGIRGLALPAMHTFSDSTDAMRAAVYGIGAALARKRIVMPYLQRYELVRLPGPALKARFAYYAVHPTHRPLAPAAEAFIEWMKQQALDERTPMPATADAQARTHA